MVRTLISSYKTQYIYFDMNYRSLYSYLANNMQLVVILNLYYSAKISGTVVS